MKPEARKIMDDLEMLQRIVRLANDNAMCDKNKETLSEMLAYTCYEIRRKYELTSMYFYVAEDKAHKKYRKEYGEEE